MNSAKIFHDVACTVCGCVCDDLQLTVEGRRIVRVQGACHLSEDWFLKQGSSQPHGGSAATAGGGPECPHPVSTRGECEIPRRCDWSRSGPLLADRVSLCRQPEPWLPPASTPANSPPMKCWNGARSMRAFWWAAKAYRKCRPSGLASAQHPHDRSGLPDGRAGTDGNRPVHDGSLRYPFARYGVSHG